MFRRTLTQAGLSVRVQTSWPSCRYGPFAQMRQLSTGDEKTSSYVESTKRQWRDYHKWRRHFRWSRQQVVQTLRDYALWSTLGLLAYYNLHKRQQRQEYEAETFVAIDRLQERIHRLDPHSPLLEGSVWAAPPEPVQETPNEPEKPDTTSSFGPKSSDEKGKRPNVFF